MKSNMTNRFSQVPKAEIQRSSFDRTSAHKTTFNAGQLIPIYCDPVLPGDTFNMKMTAFARLATPIKPIMDNLYMDTFWFFCANRLLWDNWERFNGEQDNPGDSTDFLIPIIQSDVTGYNELSIYDYLGLPTGVAISYDHSALPLRAINKIWNDWFRDENLQDSIVENKGDGPDLFSDYAIQSRGKRHDYFTSCLPWPQKSDFGAVTLPLGDKAPIETNAAAGDVLSIHSLVQDQQVNMETTTLSFGTERLELGSDPTDVSFQLYADLTDATAATINSIRQAFQIQRLFERDARGGTRYIEIIKSHFGVSSPDMRMQRSEILGTGSSPVNITPIAQTGFTATDVQTSETPQGNLAAFGTAILKNHGFTKSFTEHGYVIGFVNVRADLTYQRGLQRDWSRLTRFDHYWPALAHLGEMPVLSKEIYFDTDSVANETVFGYQEAFADYRYRPSMITGLFRSTAAQTLDLWHLSQDFSTRPVLGDNFITDKPPIERVIAVPSEPHFIFDSLMQLRCARPMPLYGVPGLVDHF